MNPPLYNKYILIKSYLKRTISYGLGCQIEEINKKEKVAMWWKEVADLIWKIFRCLVSSDNTAA
jgi:hypothetical protein